MTLAFVLIGAVTVLRCAVLMVWPIQLGMDEAQYWRWGQTLEWGYWSKPPLIGWAIHASTAVFGDAEWAIRLMTPLAHGLGAVCLALLARDIARSSGGPEAGRTGLMAALVYLLMPGVSLSSAIMSTDGLLLPIWSLSLLLLWRLRTGQGRWLGAVGLGAAIGLGFLAKYAMIYFVIGAGLAAVIDPAVRRALVSPRGLVVALTAAAVFAPHLAWNAQHSFKTLSHTADNANWEGAKGNPLNALVFLTDQMGVFGPIAFLMLLAGLAARRGWGEPGQRWLIAFIVPPLVVILVQAMISRAHANWAATAYPAASVLLTLWLAGSMRERRIAWFLLAGLIALAPLSIRSLTLETRLVISLLVGGAVLAFGAWQRFRERGFLVGSIGIHAIVALAFIGIALSPPRVSEAAGLANAFREVRYWPETVAALDAAVRKNGASTLMVDMRDHFHGLDYYGREGALSVPLRTWRLGESAKSYAEEFTLQPGEDEAVLIASARPDSFARMRADFATLVPVGEVRIPLTAWRDRRYCLYLASGFAPVPRAQAPALEARDRNAPCPVP